MSDEISTVLLSADEARECVTAINESLLRLGKEAITIRHQYLTLYEGEGWAALGYTSWRECVKAEFQQSQARVYQLLTEAKIERQLTISSPARKVSPQAVRELGKAPVKQRETIIQAIKEEPVVTPQLVRRNWNAIPPGQTLSKTQQTTGRKAKHCPTCTC